MSDYLEKEDLKFAVQIAEFAEALPTFAGTLDLTVLQVGNAQNDADFISFVITKNLAADGYKQNWVKLKDQVRYGKNGDVLAAFPPPVDVSSPPTAVQPNVEKRFRELVKIIKAHPNYTKGIGETLKIEKAETTVNPSEGKPSFKVFLDSGSPVLKWMKGIYEGVEVWVDRGTGYTKAERDLRPPFVDKHTLPPAGQSAVWKYKMIYLLKDETIGLWSDEVSVTVVGEV
jgi:hypothetical protein